MHIYVHIPFCVQKCRYCAFYSIGYDGEVADRFVNSLLREIETMAMIMPVRDSSDDSENTLYIGGGTPSILDSSQIEKIVRAIRQNFEIDEFDEFTIEVNPESVNRQKIDRYIEFGASRISIGVQSLDDEHLKFLGRVHNLKQALDAIKIANSSGIREISVDFIYGLPNFHIDSFLEKLWEIISIGVNHISLYSLTVEQNMKSANSIMPSPNIFVRGDFSLTRSRILRERDISANTILHTGTEKNISVWDLRLTRSMENIDGQMLEM